MRKIHWSAVLESVGVAVAYIAVIALLFYPVVQAGGYLAA